MICIVPCYTNRSDNHSTLLYSTTLHCTTLYCARIYSTVPTDLELYIPRPAEARAGSRSAPHTKGQQDTTSRTDPGSRVQGPDPGFSLGDLMRHDMSPLPHLSPRINEESLRTPGKPCFASNSFFRSLSLPEGIDYLQDPLLKHYPSQVVFPLPSEHH
jgi:hypothetical protein